ncbi:MAG: arylsulfatase [Fimbriimonadaceae bacterium]|nr:arylsulfatase [Fimbriimonadaceae bacterium]
MPAVELSRRHFLQTAALAAGAAAAPSCGAARRPNVVVILTDDMGFSDLGCYGGEIDTPHLDRLAAGGVRLTQFYNTARCCPTRACLLTGLYPHQAGMGHMTGPRRLDGYEGDLSPRTATLAEVVRPAGYGAYAVGKWHVARNQSPGGDQSAWPLQRGFQRYYGTINGAGSYWDPGTLTRDNTMISPFADPEYRPATFYYTDALAAASCRFISDHVAQQPAQPFLLYTAFTAAHWPMHAPEELIAKYQRRYEAGYDTIRQARFERARELGLLPREWQLSPQFGDWSKVADRRWEARCMATYAAMVERMDAGVGQIVATLRQHGQLDNTLLLYLQDNGGCQENIGRSGAATDPNLRFEPLGPEVVRTEGRPQQTRAGRPVRQGQGVDPGPDESYLSYGEAWANVSNTPFREYKHYVHEGGISTPLIAHWPAGITQRGALVTTPGHLVDVMATVLEVTGASYPTSRAGLPLPPPEGRSLRPAFDGGRVWREGLFWEHEGNRAVRLGDWKLVAKGATGAWELYDLAADRTELHNLAAVEPARVAQMAAIGEAWAARTHARPWPWDKPAAAAAAAAVTLTLPPGATLEDERAPDVARRALRIEATVSRAGDGVILAQGGTRLGYSLYVKSGVLQFAWRHDGQRTLVAAAGLLPAAPWQIVAEVTAAKRVTLSVNGSPLASGAVPGLLPETPTEGLVVGQDPGAAVGDYQSPATFGGALEQVTLQLAARR